MKNHALSVSSQFDAQLVALGNWSIPQRRSIERWLEQTTIEQKRKAAAQVMASFILEFLRKDISIEGKIRVKRLQSAVSLLEQIVFATRELGEKYYRDHINHMLKVALLAKAIAAKEPFCLDQDQSEKLIMACLFHDIAYPLGECGRIFNETIRTLKDCYTSAELFRANLIKRTEVDISTLASVIGEDESKVERLLMQLNHGLLSALEFKSFLNNQEQVLERYSKVIRAIAIHDSIVSTEIDVFEEPVIGLLVLADELQDWGRPTYEDISVIPRIEDFELKNRRIEGRFIAKNYKNFSVLKQVCSKMENLKRVILDSKRLTIKIEYEIQRFRKIDHSNYEFVLQTLYEKVNEECLDPSNNIDLSESSLFEKTFFGVDIGMPTKMELYSYLKKRQLAEFSVLKEMDIYVNTDLPELILSKKNLEAMKSLVISNFDKERISMKIQTDNGPIEGTFYGNSREKNLELMRFLAAEIRFINYLLHEIGSERLELPEGFPKFEGFAEQTVIAKVGDELKIDEFPNLYSKLELPLVTSCLRNRGCFLLAE